MPTHSMKLELLSNQNQRHYKKRKLKTNIPNEYSCKILYKILAIQIQQCNKKYNTL